MDSAHSLAEFLRARRGLEALALALRLDDDATDHLFALSRESDDLRRVWAHHDVLARPRPVE